MKSIYIDGVGLIFENWGERRIRVTSPEGQQIYLTQEAFLNLARIFREFEAEAKHSSKVLSHVE